MLPILLIADGTATLPQDVRVRFARSQRDPQSYAPVSALDDTPALKAEAATSLRASSFARRYRFGNIAVPPLRPRRHWCIV